MTDQAAEPEAVGRIHRPLNAIVCDEIRKWIITGRLAPGSRLVESSLAEELGVSRGPVREAIRQLEREGFAELTPRRGASVASVTSSEALDCYEVRTALEGVAARLAATERTSSDLAKLQQTLADGDELLKAGRWDALAQMNNEFHEALARAAHNAELVLLMGQYGKRLAWIFSRSAQQRGATAWREHKEIVDAVENRDGVLAEQLAKQHIQASRQGFVAAMLPDDEA